MTPRTSSDGRPLLHWVELALLIFFVAGSLVLVNYIATAAHQPH